MLVFFHCFMCAIGWLTNISQGSAPFVLQPLCNCKIPGKDVSAMSGLVSLCSEVLFLKYC